MNFVMHRSRTVVGFGHAIEFVKGEPTHVPPVLYQDVISAGGIPETELDLDPPKTGKAEAPGDPQDREAALFACFEDMVAANTRGSFTAGGMPHLAAMKDRLGWEVSAKERDTAWVKFQTSGAE
jgi:hypothetical protein